jgi:hypothetical protein
MQMDSVDHSDYYIDNNGILSLHKQRNLNSIDTQFMEHIAGEMIVDSTDSYASYHTEE